MGESVTPPLVTAAETGRVAETHSIESDNNTNVFVSFFRSVFGYRKTSLTLFVFGSLILTVLLSCITNSLDLTIDLPSTSLEKDILSKSWLDLQLISQKKHTYASTSNDEVHDYLESTIIRAISKSPYITYDNDLNYTNNILFDTTSKDRTTVTYYESNNLLVRINGTDSKLPALLLSAHYDSVPTSFGVTDDGMGIASLLGILYKYTEEQPERTIILNFNNNEEFGLYGAQAFLNHPWFKSISYFLNLEGTGAGGKAILFRGTDYGIINHFKLVRYPYGTSLFQQGFNNHLIHSETDYKIYYEQGKLRGLDLAFYKPRDYYHTDKDNIANIDIKSLWHMLSNALDFTEHFVAGKVDLDDQSENDYEFGIFTSIFNRFFAISISQLVLLNTILLVLYPILTLFLLIIVFHYKKNWQLSFINVIKFPVSIVISYFLLNIITRFVRRLNQFLPNSSFELIFFTLFASFLFINYFILNLINLIFRTGKIKNHDEKLIVMLEISLIYWAGLLWSTIKLGYNKIGDDHTGEFPILIIFWVQASAVIFGLIGWTFRSSKRVIEVDNSEEAEPLLRNSDEDYGSRDDRSDATSTISDGDKFSQIIKTYSYDWSLQFLIIVPISSYIVYNSGYLILDGISKSIQESLKAEKVIYNFLEIFVILWALPYLPFVFKLNRLIVLSVLLVIITGVLQIGTADSFNSSNPLKLRFVQTIDLDKSGKDTIVEVYGRSKSPLKAVLEDLPSVKLGDGLNCSSIEDGLEQCNYHSSLIPQFLPGKSFEDYLSVKILKNSSSSGSYGLLTGEIEINVPKNRYCSLNFDQEENIRDISDSSNKDGPVKSVIIYRHLDKNKTRSMDMEAEGIPEGFSTDKSGNYIFKRVNGISELLLNKLDWDKPYHIGFKWVPNVIDIASDKFKNKLGISVKCHWTDLEPVAKKGKVYDPIPVYSELLHYSPNYVSWANKEKGLVSISKYIKV